MFVYSALMRDGAGDVWVSVCALFTTRIFERPRVEECVPVDSNFQEGVVIAEG